MPSKIVNVVFTIPTSVAYESARVEISGVADNAELVEKYNELVDIFRPKPKPVAPKPVAEPMKAYSIPRKIAPADDEAGGAVIKEDVVDEKTIALQKQDILELLTRNHDFSWVGKTRQQISDKIFEITSLPLREDEYPRIIDALKK